MAGNTVMLASGLASEPSWCRWIEVALAAHARFPDRAAPPSGIKDRRDYLISDLLKAAAKNTEPHEVKHLRSAVR